jgi:hypothetical protein
MMTDQLAVNISGDQQFPKHLRMLVVGQPGVGKTTFASRFPNPLWVNAACGLPTLARIGGIPFVDFNVESDLFNVKRMIESGEAQDSLGRDIDTLVVDSVDEMQRLLLVERLRSQNRSETKLDDWGWLNSRLHAIFAGLADLDEIGVHIIYIAHTKDVNVGDDVIFKPALGGQFCEHIHEYVDMSLWMRASTIVDEDSTTVDRWLLSTPHIEAEWVNDKTGCLPPKLAVDENVFSVIHDLFNDVTVEPSSVVEIQFAEDSDDSTDVEAEVKPEPQKNISQDTEDVCNDCGSAIEAKTWSDLSKMRYNVALCGSCFKSRG